MPILGLVFFVESSMGTPVYWSLLLAGWWNVNIEGYTLGSLDFVRDDGIFRNNKGFVK